VPHYWYNHHPPDSRRDLAANQQPPAVEGLVVRLVSADASAAVNGWSPVKATRSTLKRSVTVLPTPTCLRSLEADRPVDMLVITGVDGLLLTSSSRNRPTPPYVLAIARASNPPRAGGVLSARGLYENRPEANWSSVSAGVSQHRSSPPWATSPLSRSVQGRLNASPPRPDDQSASAPPAISSSSQQTRHPQAPVRRCVDVAGPDPKQDPPLVFPQVISPWPRRPSRQSAPPLQPRTRRPLPAAFKRLASFTNPDTLATHPANRFPHHQTRWSLAPSYDGRRPTGAS